MNHNVFSLLFFGVFLMITTSGCTPVAVGSAAYGGYKGATDKRSVGTMVEDSVISSRVKTRMIGDKYVKARHVDVDVLNGVVYLIGVVETEGQKQRAADIARWVQGVRAVKNQLVVGQVSAGQALDDTMITSKIRTELLKDPDIRSTNVDVDTNNNVISLTGIVGSAREKEKVLAIAHQVGGNRKVIDNISVR